MQTQRSKKRKRTADCFKKKWLTESELTATPNNNDPIQTKLGDIFMYNEDEGVIYVYYKKMNAKVDFATGKMFEGSWKLDFLKRYCQLNCISSLGKSCGKKNPLLPPKGMVQLFQSRSTLDPESKVRKQSNSDQVKVLIDNVLLSIQMNNSILSIQEINNHMAKYITLPEF